MSRSGEPVLRVRDLTVRIDTEEASLRPSDGVSLELDPTCVAEELDDDWRVVTCSVTELDAHFVEADAPVAVAVWGYGMNVSYGHAGGMGLMPINPVW